MICPKDGVQAWERPYKTAHVRGFVVMEGYGPVNGR